MTTPPFNNDWEKELHQKLRSLPDLQAPDSLVPNVMTAIRKRHEAVVAWYQRPATTWPLSLQITLGFAAVAMFLLAVFGSQQLTIETPSIVEPGQLDAFSVFLGKAWSAIHAVGVAVASVFRTAISPLLIIVAAAACFSYLALLGIGGAIWRTVMHRQPNL